MMKLATATEAKSRKFANKRKKLRDSIWKNADSLTWSRQKYKGFATIPRTLPLILRLIKDLCPANKGDASRVYLDLWSRVSDEGFVEITNPEDFAYSAGYSGRRGLRTWAEHIQCLADLRFIKIKSQGNREIAYALIIDPYLLISDLRKKGKITDEDWWLAYIAQAQQIGAGIPELQDEAPGSDPAPEPDESKAKSA